MLKKELSEDIDSAKKLLINGKPWDWDYSTFKHYDAVYPYNNENIKGYYNLFNYEGNVLTVASSGDHMLHAILNDARNVVLFDINKLTSYYCRLKLAGVKALNRKEFFDFFGNVRDASPNFYNKNLYQKIIPYLDQDDILFWNELYNVGLSNKKRTDNLFNLVSNPYHNAFYEDTLYKELRKKVMNFDNPRFICSDLFDLPKYIHDEKFSSIFLSNIQCYISSEDEKRFMNLIEKDLDAMLEKNGMIAYGNLPITTENLNFDYRASNVYVYRNFRKK